MDGNTTRFDDRLPNDGIGGAVARYTVASRDADGNVSPTRSRILEVLVARHGERGRSSQLRSDPDLHVVDVVSVELGGDAVVEDVLECDHL